LAIQLPRSVVLAGVAAFAGLAALVAVGWVALTGKGVAVEKALGSAGCTLTHHPSTAEPTFKSWMRRSSTRRSHRAVAGITLSCDLGDIRRAGE
jgi:hypothetical protein